MKMNNSQKNTRHSQNKVPKTLTKTMGRFDLNLQRFKAYVRFVLWLFKPFLGNVDATSFIFKVENIWSKSGKTFLVLYLKQCHIAVQHYVSGNPLKATDDIYVKLRRGLPRVIPLELRLQIESGSWLHTKLVLTLLISFRAMIIPPVLKTKSITAPFNGNSETLPIYEVKEGFKALGISLPRKLIPGDLLNIVKSSPGGVFSTLHAPMDALVFSRQARHLLEPFKVLSDYSGSLLYYDLLRESRLADILMVNKNRHYIGKLSRKLEAAGKVRLFAMVDVWTQSILKPYHNEIFNVLKCIVTDGTFDQDKPIKALQKVLKNRPNDQYVASFDLSSATDRLPIKLQMQVWAQLFDSETAVAWRSLLVERDYVLDMHEYEVPDLMKMARDFQGHVAESGAFKGMPLNFLYRIWIAMTSQKGIAFRYAVGQPMGAYTSWAMLALTHHVIVQIAAMRAGLDKFGDYAVLGDDIVIANQAVARSYQYIMKTLGVEINMTKSLVSSKGVFEMAKRLCSPDQDFTPIGAKLLARGLKHPGELLNILRDMVSKSFNFARIDVKGYLYGKDTYFNRISESKKKDLLWSLTSPFALIDAGNIFSRNFEMKDTFSHQNRASLIDSVNMAVYELLANQYLRSCDVLRTNYHWLISVAQSWRDSPNLHSYLPQPNGVQTDLDYYSLRKVAIDLLEDRLTRLVRVPLWKLRDLYLKCRQIAMYNAKSTAFFEESSIFRLIASAVAPLRATGGDQKYEDLWDRESLDHPQRITKRDIKFFVKVRANEELKDRRRALFKLKFTNVHKTKNKPKKRKGAQNLG